jgi:hypothetical protein
MPTQDEIAALVAAATEAAEAAEALMIATAYSRRPAVRERLERLRAALVPFAPRGSADR